MKKFGIKHPILFEILLIVVGFVLAVVFSIPASILYFDNDTTMAISRILSGVFLFVVFLYCFRLKKQFSGLKIALPAFLFVLWNVVNCFLTGGHVSVPSGYELIQAIAPAAFEEVIFREISIYHLKESGKSPITVMIISALLFGAIHLTNIVGGQILQTLVQCGYATVIGLVFAAIYIRSDDLFTLMIIHFLIDFFNRVFVGSTTTPYYLLIAFFILLAGEAVYAFYLVSKKK
ncbi:MAG: CPBP family intramembrane metalloprotease [Erysipelotrichaceae bacterium]|nr:CPBP family intramembrane metalloprotease [Erysipelotrichaceae bacterium]